MQNASEIRNKGQESANSCIESKCALKTCNRSRCRIPWHRVCWFSKAGFVTKLWPMLALVGFVEISAGIILLFGMILFAKEYDELYSTGDTKVYISSATFGVLTILTLSGVLLIISLMLERRRLLLTHILMSAILCVYIFTLAAFKIHFGILKLRKDAYQSDGKNVLLNTACLLGILTLFGSVVQFIGNVAVITYYYLKFIQPTIFSYEMN